MEAEPGLFRCGKRQAGTAIGCCGIEEDQADEATFLPGLQRYPSASQKHVHGAQGPEDLLLQETGNGSLQGKPGKIREES